MRFGLIPIANGAHVVASFKLGFFLMSDLLDGDTRNPLQTIWGQEYANDRSRASDNHLHCKYAISYCLLLGSVGNP